MGQPILGRDKPFAGFVRNGNAGRATWFQPLSPETQIFLAFAGAARAGEIRSLVWLHCAAREASRQAA
jgi:hypothetical protein